MTYKIKETREFYGPQTRTGFVSDYFGNPETFKTADCAQERVSDLDAQIYHTAHGESARPNYEVVKA